MTQTIDPAGAQEHGELYLKLREARLKHFAGDSEAPELPKLYDEKERRRESARRHWMTLATMNQAVAFLGMVPKTIRRLAAEGTLRCHRRGKLTRFAWPDLVALKNARQLGQADVAGAAAVSEQVSA